MIFFLVGDLDSMLSRYTLTPLKLVYKKLRRLVDCGCIFIGHGLSKDFRIISMIIHPLPTMAIVWLTLFLQDIYVPPERVIDTVDLYFLKSRQRRLSLRFLSWFILGEHIQTDNHDSIEDARSVLMMPIENLKSRAYLIKNLRRFIRKVVSLCVCFLITPP